MAQNFPMLLTDFFEGLPIQTFTPDLGEAMEFNQTAAGEITSADLGPRLWKNDIGIRTGYYGEIEQIKARLNLLRQAGRSLLVHSMPFVAPQYDPDGSILGASVITLTNVAANNRDITLSGFPVGYTLTVGDFLSFTYGSNPVRYAMHQVVETAVANASGIINLIEVVPFIRPGWPIDAVVTLIKPRYKAVVVPNSTGIGSAGGQFVSNIGFSLIQTLR